MIGKTLAHYQIVEKLGEGGMGVVYKARDVRLERFVALKVLPAEKALDPVTRKRFLREAQAASILNHPHIVIVYDITSADDTDLIVMEYIEGHPLRRLIPKTGMPVGQFLAYSIQIADALSAAHKAGIIHRDLKPSNIMVNREGRLKVLDFGLAKLASAAFESSGDLTLTGAVIGTANYMSPEQAVGEPMDHRSDIFSFGVLMYEMLAGKAPFRGANPVAVMCAIRYDEPPPLREVRLDIPLTLHDLVHRAMVKAPAHRFASMGEIELLLRRIQGEWNSSKTGDTPTASMIFPPELRSLTGSLGQSGGSKPPTTGSERAAIAVLPFRCLSADPEDAYMADGIATEIISALSGVPGVRVAPHLASTRFKDSSPDLRVIAQSLNVRYILTGSLRRSGKRTRVIAELADVEEDNLIWSRTYDRAVKDVFEVQEDIARSVVGATGGQLLRLRAEQASRAPAESLDAWGLVRKAYHFWNYAFHIAGVEQSLNLLRRAVELDPGYAAAHGYLGFYLNQRLMLFISPDREADRREALESTERAFELAPGDPEVLEIVGLVWYCNGHWERAINVLRRAVRIAPFNLVAWGYLALCLGWGGSDKEVAEAQEILDRLIAGTPDHPSLPYWYYFQAGVWFRQGNFEAGAECARKCFELQPRYIIARISYANAMGALGRMEEARAAWAQVLAANPYITQEAYMDDLNPVARTPARAEPHVRGLFAAGIFQ